MLMDSPCPRVYGQHQLRVGYRRKEDDREEEVDKDDMRLGGRCGGELQE